MGRSHAREKYSLSFSHRQSVLLQEHIQQSVGNGSAASDKCMSGRFCRRNACNPRTALPAFPPSFPRQAENQNLPFLRDKEGSSSKPFVTSRCCQIGGVLSTNSLVGTHCTRAHLQIRFSSASESHGRDRWQLDPDGHHLLHHGKISNLRTNGMPGTL